MTRRHPTRVALGALAVLALVSAHDLWRWIEARRLNEAIAAGLPPAGVDQASAAPELRFAQAYALAASGTAEAALSRYGALHGDPALGRAARYNGANLLLRQALAMHAQSQPGQALALVELAKEQYRDVLRADASDWGARYNLERALRLVPEADEADEAPPDLKRDAERAATTMRGFSPGLP